MTLLVMCEIAECNNMHDILRVFKITKCFYCVFMAVGTGGRGELSPPPIFCQPIKFKSLKITTYKLLYINLAKIGS